MVRLSRSAFSVWLWSETGLLSRSKESLSSHVFAVVYIVTPGRGKVCKSRGLAKRNCSSRYYQTAKKNRQKLMMQLFYFEKKQPSVIFLTLFFNPMFSEKCCNSYSMQHSSQRHLAHVTFWEHSLNTSLDERTLLKGHSDQSFVFDLRTLGSWQENTRSIEHPVRPWGNYETNINGIKPSHTSRWASRIY